MKNVTEPPQPRCPKCGKSNLVIGQDDDGDCVDCLDCKFTESLPKDWTLLSMAQFFGPSASQPQPVTEMYLCETERLILKPNKLYRFSVHPTCERCGELSKAAPSGSAGPEPDEEMYCHVCGKSTRDCACDEEPSAEAKGPTRININCPIHGTHPPANTNKCICLFPAEPAVVSASPKPLKITHEFVERCMKFAELGKMLNGPERPLLEKIKRIWNDIEAEKIAAQPVAADLPKVEEIKYLKLLRWFKLFYDFYQKDITDKPSACASALAEDGELQEFIREADRI